MTEEQKDKEFLNSEDQHSTNSAFESQSTEGSMAGDTSADTPVSPSDSPSEGASSPNSTSSLDGSAAGGSSVGEDSELSPEELLAQARSEIEELKTQALYRQAEFENYRRRTIKEKTDLILNGSKSAVTAILPIVDDLERALPSMKNADDVAAVAEGVELILQKFLKALAGLGVKQIETEGKDFDVDLHEAIAQVPGVPAEQKGRVIDCVEKGYTLNDQVIRHAKVAVGM